MLAYSSIAFFVARPAIVPAVFDILGCRWRTVSLYGYNDVLGDVLYSDTVLSIHLVSDKVRVRLSYKYIFTDDRAPRTMRLISAIRSDSRSKGGLTIAVLLIQRGRGLPCC